jgi:excisionase family DNA binding protein
VTLAAINPTEDVNSDEWLSLSAASELIGVHPATLRAWANQGRVASRRTAGGHRRFRRSDLQAKAKTRRSTESGTDMLIHSALGRVRLTMDQADMPWLDRLSDVDRAQHRELGRRLMISLAATLNETAADISPEKLGIEYAQLSRQQGLKLTEAVQTFLFFRDSLVDSAIQLINYADLPSSPDWPVLNRRLTEFTNAILLGLIEHYQELKA